MWFIHRKNVNYIDIKAYIRLQSKTMVTEKSVPTEKLCVYDIYVPGLTSES